MTRISGAPNPKCTIAACGGQFECRGYKKATLDAPADISLPLKMAFSERTAMLIGLDPATAAAADPPLGDATTPWDALRNVHECRIAARS